jgi:predicted metalloprotease
VLFPETGKRVGGRFLEYWQQNGGLPQQGYPISDEFVEVSELNGQPYTVQYFERAVFEYHPENPPPHDVLLSQLGTFQYAARYQSDLPNLAGDVDGDSAGDDTDRCPRSAENVNDVFDLDGCPDTMQTLLIFAAEHINAFWAESFRQSGIRYVPPLEFVAYNEPVETECGPAEPYNAFYCALSHSIYYHYDFLQEQLDTDGDFAPVTILAHEWGHLVQGNLGFLQTRSFTIDIELQADCLAGAWAASAGEQGLLDPGDLDEGAVALFRAGDDQETPWFDPGAHGQPDQRVDAFATGLEGGAGACTE